MNKILVLHGWDSNSQSNWFPWLKQVGEQRGYEVMIPDLPEPKAPVLDEWLREAYNQGGELGEGDIIIGHSMGGKTAAHFIERYNISGITAILVGPSYETIEDELDLGDPEDIKSKLIVFNESQLNFERLNSLDNKYIVFLSDDDKFINPVSATKYYSQIHGAQIISFHNAGHFMKSEGFQQLPEILNYLKK